MSAIRKCFSEMLIHARKINQKVIVTIMSFLYFGYISCIRIIIGHGIYTRLMTVVMLLSFVLLLPDLMSGLKQHPEGWWKRNIILLVYFACRLISFFQNGCDYTIITSIILEGYYLIVLLYSGADGFRSKVQTGIFLTVSIIYHGMNLLVYCCFDKFSVKMQEWFYQNTKINEFPRTAISTNPNAGGVFCALAVIVILVWILENRQLQKRIALLVLLGFHAVCFAILYTDVRSAMVSVAACIMMFLISFVIKGFRGQTAILFVLGCIVLAVIGLALFFRQPEYNRMEPLTEKEKQYNNLSSSRYVIWKTCFITFDKNNVTGRGSLKLEKKFRRQYAEEHENEVTTVHVTAARFDPHNGYIEILVVTGWLGFAVLMLFMFQITGRAKHLNQGYWYLIVCFILINNIFEGLFILDRFFPCFYLFQELSQKDKVN